MHDRIQSYSNDRGAVRITTLASLALTLGLAFFIPAGVYADDERLIDAATVIGSSPYQWLHDGTERVEGPSGPELALSPAAAGVDQDTDMLLDFDEVSAGGSPVESTGRWSVKMMGPYEQSAAARFGAGAGVFRAPVTKLTLEPVSSTLFVPELPMGDFSIEFWLKPTRADSGEIIMMWKATRRSGKAWLSQQVSCVILRNRIVFGFLNFFANPSGAETMVSLQGASVLVPGVWSHHLVRFDSHTGMVEYLMNGKTEAVEYATSTKKQAGTVFNPIAGSSGKLDLAQNYTGMIDELRISSAFVEQPALARFRPAGGTIISPIIDLGATNSTIRAIEAQTRTPGESAIHWSYRAADSSVGWQDDAPAWIPFTPGTQLSSPDGTGPKGRYLQLKLMLYPDASGEQSPSVGAIKVRYLPDEPPSPPSTVRATGGDGRITVRWSSVSESDVRGYVVYYGLASGDYFGTGSTEGSSPVFVKGAGSTSLTLNGLKNGTLYFIAVAAYDDATPPHIGEFSREISARPSRVSP